MELIGRYVDVIANNITYTGKLVEVSETEVYLEGESGWVVIPVNQIVSIRKKEES